MRNQHKNLSILKIIVLSLYLSVFLESCNLSSQNTGLQEVVQDEQSQEELNQALIKAVSNGNVDEVEDLIARGAEVTTEIIDIAEQRGNTEIVELLGINVVQAKLVACVGDSITFGAGIPDHQNNSYPAQLSRMLEKFNNQWHALNYGVSGATLLRNGDKPYIQQRAYNQALAAEPDDIIIMLGTNDSKSWNWAYKDDYVSDYIFLIDSFAELPSKPRIWICKPVPAFSASFGITNAVIKDEIIPMIDQISELRDVEVIDLYTPMLGTSSMFPDGIHPNADGARMMAETIFPLLTNIAEQQQTEERGTMQDNSVSDISIFEALQSGDIENVTVFLNQGIDINTKDSRGEFTNTIMLKVGDTFSMAHSVLQPTSPPTGTPPTLQFASTLFR